MVLKRQQTYLALFTALGLNPAGICLHDYLTADSPMASLEAKKGTVASSITIIGAMSASKVKLLILQLQVDDASPVIIPGLSLPKYPADAQSDVSIGNF